MNPGAKPAVTLLSQAQRAEDVSIDQVYTLLVRTVMRIQLSVQPKVFTEMPKAVLFRIIPTSPLHMHSLGKGRVTPNVHLLGKGVQPKTRFFHYFA